MAKEIHLRFCQSSLHNNRSKMELGKCLITYVMREKLSTVQKTILDLSSALAKQFPYPVTTSQGFFKSLSKHIIIYISLVGGSSQGIGFILEKLNFHKECRKHQILWYHLLLFRSISYFTIHETHTARTSEHHHHLWL